MDEKPYEPGAQRNALLAALTQSAEGLKHSELWEHPLFVPVRTTKSGMGYWLRKLKALGEIKLKHARYFIVRGHEVHLNQPAEEPSTPPHEGEQDEADAAEAETDATQDATPVERPVRLHPMAVAAFQILSVSEGGLSADQIHRHPMFLPVRKTTYALDYHLNRMLRLNLVTIDRERDKWMVVEGAEIPGRVALTGMPMVPEKRTYVKRTYVKRATNGNGVVHPQQQHISASAIPDLEVRIGGGGWLEIVVLGKTLRVGVAK